MPWQYVLYCPRVPLSSSTNTRARSDVSMGFQGQAARDIARHFIQRWNHVKTVKAKFDPSMCRVARPGPYLDI